MTSRPRRRPAGNLTFNVSNYGSKVTEFYLYSADGKRIVGEVENIGPGLQGKLIVTAGPGQLPDRVPSRDGGPGHPCGLHGHQARRRLAGPVRGRSC